MSVLTATCTYFMPVRYRTGLNPDAIAVGDLNSDGRPDAAVMHLDGVVTVMLNQCIK